MTLKKYDFSLKIILVIVVTTMTCSFFSLNKKKLNDQADLSYVFYQTKKLIQIIEKSIIIIDSASFPNKTLQLKSNYFKARKHYKKIEAIIEYCAPFDVKYFINGALIKKSDLELGSRIVDPHGFQVIEEQLFGIDSLNVTILKNELELLKSSFQSFEKKLRDKFLSDSQVIESFQFELIRISCLSLSGSDATFTQINVTECISVFEGLRMILSDLQKKHINTSYPTETHLKLISEIKLAEKYCSINKNYISFNRLYFITHHIKPIYKLLVILHKSKLFPFTPVNYAIDLTSDKLFEREAYNLNYFSVKAIDTLGNAKQAKLGELLFFDPILSGNNNRACASCHKPDLAFSDGLEKNINFEKNNFLDRNTPSLLNTIFQKHFFYDGRARQLEQQVNDVLHNQKEMNTTVDEMINRLNISEEYKVLFNEAYKNTSDTLIGYYGILKAITEYEKTLISMNSRFDKYIKGEYKTLTKEEINGYNLFAGKALCGSCHFFPLFNGLVPPIYNDTEYEVIGVPKNKDSKNIDLDEGRIIVSKSFIHKFAFKTPTIRNSGLTSPYMHNGIYQTLDEVIDFYNNGGGQGLGINIPHQTLPFDSLQLSKKEIQNIKAFLLSLTDTTNLTKKPKRLPKFNEEKFNNRVVGGSY